MEAQLVEDRVPSGDAIPIDKLADELPPDAWAELKKYIDQDRENARKIAAHPPVVPPSDNPPPPPPR